MLDNTLNELASMIAAKQARGLKEQALMMQMAGLQQRAGAAGTREDIALAKLGLDQASGRREEDRLQIEAAKAIAGQRNEDRTFNAAEAQRVFDHASKRYQHLLDLNKTYWSMAANDETAAQKQIEQIHQVFSAADAAINMLAKSGGNITRLMNDQGFQKAFIMDPTIRPYVQGLLAQYATARDAGTEQQFMEAFKQDRKNALALHHLATNFTASTDAGQYLASQYARVQQWAKRRGLQVQNFADQASQIPGFAPPPSETPQAAPAGPTSQAPPETPSTTAALPDTAAPEPEV